MVWGLNTAMAFGSSVLDTGKRPELAADRVLIDLYVELLKFYTFV
jgi:hypothetical protein